MPFSNRCRWTLARIVSIRSTWRSKRNFEAAGCISHDLKHWIVALLVELDFESTSQNFTQLKASVQRYGSQQHIGNPMLDAALPIKE